MFLSVVEIDATKNNFTDKNLTFKKTKLPNIEHCQGLK